MDHSDSENLEKVLIMFGFSLTAINVLTIRNQSFKNGRIIKQTNNNIGGFQDQVMNMSIENIQSLTLSFQPIQLKDAEMVAMLKRIDTKYIANEEILMSLLKYWKDDYYILEINGNRILDYRTVYFDTPDFKCYNDHHKGKSNRYKIRFRDYLKSELTFFEIKRKINGKETHKTRKKVEFNSVLMDDSLQDLMASEGIILPNLELKIINTFQRITMIRKDLSERLTIDNNISFTNTEGAEVSLPGITIIELKQEKADYSSKAMQTLKERGVRQANFSKYLTAVSLLENQVKYNNLKPLHLKLNQIKNEYANKG